MGAVEDNLVKVTLKLELTSGAFDPQVILLGPDNDAPPRTVSFNADGKAIDHLPRYEVKSGKVTDTLEVYHARWRIQGTLGDSITLTLLYDDKSKKLTNGEKIKNEERTLKNGRSFRLGKK